MIAYEKQFLLKEILRSNCFAFNQAISANEMRTETFMRLLTRPPDLLGGIVPLNLSAASQRDSWLQIFLTCQWQLFKCLNLDCYFNQVFGKTVNFL